MPWWGWALIAWPTLDFLGLLVWLWLCHHPDGGGRDTPGGAPSGPPG